MIHAQLLYCQREEVEYSLLTFRKNSQILLTTFVYNMLYYTIVINCNYYNIDEFTEANFNPSKSFSILHLNIHSIKKHIKELKITLQVY